MAVRSLKMWAVVPTTQRVAITETYFLVDSYFAEHVLTPFLVIQDHIFVLDHIIFSLDIDYCTYLLLAE